MALAKSQRSLRSWTKQKWGTKSGKKSAETGERYLPKKAIESLSDSEYAATTAKKRKDTAAGKQHSKQPKRIAKKTRGARQFKFIGGNVNEGLKRKELDRLFHSEPLEPDMDDYNAVREERKKGIMDGPARKNYDKKDKEYTEYYQQHLNNTYKQLEKNHNIIVRESKTMSDAADTYSELSELPREEAIIKIFKDSNLPVNKKIKKAISQLYREGGPRANIRPAFLAEHVYNKKFPMYNNLGYKILESKFGLLNNINPNKKLVITLNADASPEYKESILVEELKHVHQLRGTNAIKTGVAGAIEYLKDVVNPNYDRYKDEHTIEGIHRRKDEFNPQLKKYGYSDKDDVYISEKDYFESRQFKSTGKIVSPYDGYYNLFEPQFNYAYQNNNALKNAANVGLTGMIRRNVSQIQERNGKYYIAPTISFETGNTIKGQDVINQLDSFIDQDLIQGYDNKKAASSASRELISNLVANVRKK